MNVKLFVPRGMGKTRDNHPVLSASSINGGMLLLVTTLTACAFLLPLSGLPWLLFVNALLIAHGKRHGAKLRHLVLFAVVQSIITLSLYLILHTADELGLALLALLRLMLAVVPAWWFAVASSPDHTASFLQRILPFRWAFVVAASFNLLPFIIKELGEIYQLQRLRGARVSPKEMANPKNWPEFVHCVVTPLLIHIIKLSKQLSVAAQCRHFGQVNTPTRWVDPNDAKQ